MAAFQPQAFGKYFLVDKLAMGGMAEIFLAKSQLKDDTRGYLVIKRILPHFTGNAQFVDMFIDEAKISSLLSHVNIVPLFDLGKIGDTYFLAMEYVPGQDLKGVVKRCADRGVRLSYEHAAYVMREVCLGLDYAHTKHDGGGRPLAIVHRDISPQNVLVGYDGAVKITDFGIAKASSKLDSTQVGTLKGKFGYMAPEQVVTGMDLDHRSDIFAAGVILWELITGQRLFAGRNEIEILERVRAARIEPPSTLDAEVPRELERIIFKSLMKDREKRYQWAKEMANELTRFLAQVSPRFGAADMSAVMKELFASEIDNIKAKFNVVIGVAVDRAHVERGAELEASRPDHREDDERRPTVPPPKKAQMVTNSTVDPGGEPDDGEPRTTVAQIPPPTREPDRTRMSPSGRFVMPDVAPPPPPQTDAADSSTSAMDLLAEVDAEAAEQGIRREKTDERKAQRKAPPPPPPPPPSRPAADPDDEWEERVAASTQKNTRRGRRGPSRIVRVTTWLVILLVAAGIALASLLYTGAVPNPFAAPIIEVATGVESAAISIDGNVVLASGRTGRWPVGTGRRVVEVRAKGYKTFTTTLDLSKGDVAIVDAFLEPADDATVQLVVNTVPPGATVWLGEEPSGTTPVTLQPRLGDYTLKFSRPGYDEKSVPIALKRPGVAAPLTVTLLPNVASVAVTTEPPGALLSIDGKASGKTPVTVEGLTPGQSIVVQVVLKGYQTESRTVTVPGGDALPVEIPLTSTAAPRAPTPAPTPAGTAAPLATPEGTPIPALGPNMGLLSIEVTGGWGEVYVDGVRVTARTPLEKAALAAGQHSVRIVNPATGSERTVTVLITAGKETRRSLALE